MRNLDVDEKNLEYARKNILANSLQTRIRPVKTTSSGPLIPLDTLGINRYDYFQMLSSTTSSIADVSRSLPLLVF